MEHDIHIKPWFSKRSWIRALVCLCGKHHGPFFIHIGMILSILGLSVVPTEVLM